MTDETLIPTPDAPEAANEAVNTAETTDVVADTPETDNETIAESADVVVETPEVENEAVAESAGSEETSEDLSAVVSEAPEAPAPAEPVRSTPLTALSARAERPARAQSTGGGGAARSDDRGGDRGGRRDDRRGGKSGFEAVKKEFEEVLLEVGRVTKVTSGGRQLRFRAAVVIGDRNGRVGFGLGKAREVSIAVEKAVNSAKRNLITVPLENGTVPFQVETKFKSVKIMIHPATEGTGIIAGGSARRILELAGCQNILSKRHGGRNVITTAYATMEALKKYQVKN